VRSGILVGIGFLAGDRLSEDLTTRPWLLAVGGLAFGMSIVIGRAVVVRRATAPASTGTPTSRTRDARR
jgi:hypothetical protein